jgi:hypothetical protein
MKTLPICAVTLALWLASLAPASPENHRGLIHGSGRWWHALDVESRDGGGPPNVLFQLCWPADRSQGYQVSLFYVDWYEEEQHVKLPLKLFITKRLTGDIRFKSLEAHANPSNDIWDDKDGTHKIFPHVLFVGQGTERHRPVTLIWDIEFIGKPRTELVQIAKVFDGDVTYLDGPIHGRKDKNSLLVEHARASWLPKNKRPHWAGPNQRIKRTWTFNEDDYTFNHGDWQSS